MVTAVKKRVALEVNDKAFSYVFVHAMHEEHFHSESPSHDEWEIFAVVARGLPPLLKGISRSVLKGLLYGWLNQSQVA